MRKREIIILLLAAIIGNTIGFLIGDFIKGAITEIKSENNLE